MTSQPLRVAVIGCGVISDIYLQNLQTFADLDVVACADLDPERARQKAEQHGIAIALSPDQVYAHPDIDLIVNLTVPAAHAEVAVRALNAGKHVYNEKPLALSFSQARQMVELAHLQKLRLGCAPDTVLGAGLQTAREVLGSGVIGTPLSATAFMVNHGHESWHPDPAFYYQPGAGPMFDMGPYYLSALIHLLGPVERVSGMTQAGFAERTITSQPRRGERITVNTPTHIAGLLKFQGGATGSIITSFDVWGSHLPLLELHGTLGSLSLPDPNTFGGPLRLKVGEGDWEDVPLTRPYAENTRGLGVAELAASLRAGRPHLASAEVALHVLELMHGILDSAERRTELEMTTRPARPASMSRLPLPVQEIQHD